MKFNKNVMKIDAAKVADEIASAMRRQIMQDLKKEGAIVGISGGIDSSVCAALSAKAMGPDKVLGVIMPEDDSSPDSQALAENLAKHLGIDYVVDNVTGALKGFNCYERRNEAIRQIVPDFKESYKTKITIAHNPLEKESLNYFKVAVEKPGGEIITKRMPPKQYLQVVAASNFKQRSRMTTLYYHAERLNRAVIGTGNKDEHELGFFVKYGDGGADLKPIAHLYKLQVYMLAEALDIPDNIRGRIPTTDTYSAEVTQTEFFFGVPFEILDMVWWGLENNVSAEEMAPELDLKPDQVSRVMKYIQTIKRNTNYLRQHPLEISE